MRVVIGSTDIKKTVLFTDIVRHIRSVSLDVIFRFDEEGLYIQAMDQSHISLLELRLAAGWFDEYTLKAGVPEAVGINTKMLFKVMSCRTKDQPITWTTNEDNVDIQFPKSATSVQKDFSIPTIDIETELLTIHEVSTQADFTMESKLFESLMVDLSTYGDEIAFECTEEGIKILAKGDTGQMNTTIPMDDLMEYSIDEGEELKIRYASSLLQLASQFSKLAATVSIGVSTTQPLRMKAELAEGSYIQYFIAPKAEE
jgi:proliferating cell nuclear antigen